MTVYAPIHGSGQGPEGWKLPVEELERPGQHALTPAMQVDRTDEAAAFHAET
jgi:hypothetical protein